MKGYRLLLLSCILWMSISWGSSAKLYAIGNGQFQVFAASANTCPEGQYLDLSTNTCRNLAKNYGFKADEFASHHGSKEVTLADCSQNALLNALDSVRSGGGTVKLPACTINVSQNIDIPSGVLLEGAGISKTKLQASSSFTGNLLRIYHQEHVVVRDLSIDGAGSISTGISTQYSHNVMVERVDAGNADGAGMRFRYRRNFTVRYSASHDAKTYHGIGTKDCFPKSSTPDEQECADSAGSVSPGALWTNNYAIYSNRFYKNGEYGLDSHSSDGEVAGNVMEGNRYGTKFPDASNLWIHHNRIVNNREWGSHLYATVDIAARAPHNVVFYENEISGNGSYPIMMRAPANNVYLINNTYQNNSPNSLLVKDVAAYTCSGSPDANMGASLKTASGQQCDLAAVAHIFGQDNNAPIPVDPEVTPAPVDPVVPTPIETVAPTPANPEVTPAPADPQVTPAPADPEVTPAPVETEVAPVDPGAPEPVDPTPADTVPQPQPESTPSVQPGVASIPGRIEAEDYKEGGEGVGYHDTTADNLGGEYRADGVDIEETSDISGKYNTGWTTQGEWLAYDVNAAAGSYLLSARVGTWDKEAEKALHFEIDGAKATGPLSFVVGEKDGGWVNVTSAPVQLTAGVHEIKVVMDADHFRLNYIEIQADPNQTPPAEEAPVNPTPTPESELPEEEAPTNPTPEPRTGLPNENAPVNGSLYGQVTFEGRPPAPHSSWATDLVVRVYAPGQTEPSAFHALTSSESGQFQIDSLAPGAYQVAVESLTSLRQIADVQMAGERVDVDFGQLVEGDAVNDNAINILDFSLVARGFDACVDSNRFVLTADFNRDGCINSADLALVKQNFGQQGRALTDGVEERTPTAQRIGELRNRQAGEQFSVPVVINNMDNLLVDAAALYLNFDPSAVRVIDVALGGQFETVLAQDVNNETGQINYAVGTLKGGVSLPITLMTITFEAKTQIGASALDLSNAPTRQSEISYQGQAVFSNIALSDAGVINLETAQPQQIFLPIASH